MTLKAPFPYFGGKQKIVDLVWSRFGNPRNYVEPFFGSGAVLLGRKQVGGIETVNDKDGFVCNFWRAVKHDPEAVADAAFRPVYENELHAVHLHLIAKEAELTERLEGDLGFYDTSIAGMWAWGLCCWIGSGWCTEDGPWVQKDGKMVQGEGRGVCRKIPMIAHTGRGLLAPSVRSRLPEFLQKLQLRLQHVRVCCGDWTRVVGKSSTYGHGETAIFFDPPYDTSTDLYGAGNEGISAEVRKWCVQNGDNPLLKLALCGYDNEHDFLLDYGWSKVNWDGGAGFSAQGGKRSGAQERIWFNTNCNNKGMYLF